jgi:hypothetical protein
MVGLFINNTKGISPSDPKQNYSFAHGMKTDIIVPKGTWPVSDTEEASRLERYRINNLLFRNRYQDVWPTWHDRVTRNWDREDLRIAFVVANFCQILSLLCADLLVGEQGEDFGASCKGEKANQGLQDIISANHFNITAYEVSGIDTSMRGDGVYKLVVRNGKVRIYGQPANTWFPLVEEDNLKEIKAHILAWKTTKNGQDYLRKEIHERGRIYNQAFRLNGQMIEDQVKLSELGLKRIVDGQEADYPEQEDTKLPDDFLIVHNPNWGLTDQIYGVDDYENIDTLVGEFAIMLSRNSMVLAKHTDPSMYGDHTYLTQKVSSDGNVEYTLPSGGTFFPVSADSKPPGYITWDGQLEAAEKQIDRLLECLFYCSETSSAAFGLDKDAVAESGVALKRRLFRTLAKINRKKLFADPAIKDVLEIAQKLDNEWTSANYTPERPSIDWKDGLPDDDTEVGTYCDQRLNNNTLSRVEAIIRMDNVDEETAKERAEKIQKEMDEALPEFGRGGVKGQTGQAGQAAKGTPTIPEDPFQK